MSRRPRASRLLAVVVAIPVAIVPLTALAAPAQADSALLQISGGPNEYRMNTGEGGSWTFVADNAGTTPSPSLKMTIQLNTNAILLLEDGEEPSVPKGTAAYDDLTVAGAMAKRCAIDVNTETAVCNIGVLAPGETVPVTISVHALLGTLNDTYVGWDAALNVTPDINGEILGLRETTAVRGALDSATGVPGGIDVRGWAWDLGWDYARYLTVETSIGGTQSATTLTTVQPRPDVDRVFGITADAGFSGFIPTTKTGEQQVCITGIDLENERAVHPACKTVTIPGPAPQGRLDTAAGVAGGVSVTGWAFDPDALSSASQVDLTVGGAAAGSLSANGVRSDVNEVKDVSGDHGFSGTVATTKTGPQQVCATAVNVGAGSDTALGCRTVTIPNTSPQGWFDTAAGVAGGVSVTGWAFDPDALSSASQVNVTVGGAAAGSLPANGVRSDVNRVKAVSGDHGFSGTVATTKTGPQQVCITAVNVGAGSDTALGCRTVIVPDTSPQGRLDSATVNGSAVQVRGWAFDPDATAAADTVRVTVAGTAVGTLTANVARSDVNRVENVAGDHGFDAAVPTTLHGVQQVCAIAVNVGGGADTALGCRSVTLP